MAAFLRTAVPAAGTTGADLLARAQGAVGTSVYVVDRLSEAGIGDVAVDPDQAEGRAAADDGGAGEYVAGDVTRGLAAAANLVGHRLGTQVIVVNAGGSAAPPTTSSASPTTRTASSPEPGPSLPRGLRSGRGAPGDRSRPGRRARAAAGR